MKRYSLVLPNHLRRREAAVIAEKVAAEMSDWFGGVTVTTADGGWQDRTGRYIAEPVLVLTSLDTAREDRADVNKVHMDAWARTAKVVLCQETVLWYRDTVDEAFFI